MDVFDSDGGVGYKIIDFEGSASAFCELFVDFGPFGQRQDAAIEPLLSWFRCLGCHAGLGGGLRARMAARIWSKTLPDTAALLPVGK